MCIAPNTLPDGTRVACHECWQCREQAVNDWVGRNIAESYTAKATLAVTLTYGRNRANDADHESAIVLTYSDVQKFIKRLRFHGYDVRYHVTGEFGERKGRAHWHGVLHFYGKAPPVVLNKNWMWEAVDIDGQRVFDKKTGEYSLFWPHGYSYVTKVNYNSVRYNCKYIMKGMGEDMRQGHMAMSKKPPLGSAYFQQLAERYVKQGLAPQTLEYKFPEVRRRKKNGREEVVPFMLKDRPAELFLEHYISTWEGVHGSKPWPRSELVDLFYEYGKVVCDEMLLIKRDNPRLKPYQPPERPKAQRKPPMDHADWRRDFDRRMGDGSQSQRRAEQQWRERQDDDDFAKSWEFKHYDEDGKPVYGARRRRSH